MFLKNKVVLVLKKIFITPLFLILIMFLSVSCSDTKPERLFVNFSDDLNSTTIGLNRKLQIHVYANYDDASQDDVTSIMSWSSSDTTVASVKDGLVSSTSKVAQVEISYKTESQGSSSFEQKYNLNVKALELLKIELSQSSLTLYEDEEYQLNAKGLFEDNETSETFYQDITNDCEWESLDGSLIGVNNSDAKGLVKAIKEGFSTIVASNLTQSASTDVEVKKIFFTQVELNATKDTLNVEQKIELQVTALSSSNQKVLLDADELEWSSSDSEVISMEKNIATALKHGTATIVATLKTNSDLSSSLLLNVDKEKYMRLFKNGVEVEMPFAQTTEYDVFPKDFDTFTLHAVGQNFIVNDVAITDFEGAVLTTLDASFDALENGQVIVEDTNVTYKLLHEAEEKEIHYFYTIDDAFKNSFSQKYKEID